jgi:hypothetical protein
MRARRGEREAIEQGSADWVSGADGADRLFGRGDSDHIYGGPGGDRLNAGRGVDRLFVEPPTERTHPALVCRLSSARTTVGSWPR